MIATVCIMVPHGQVGLPMCFLSLLGSAAVKKTSVMLR